MKISKASPIRFYKNGFTDIENGGFKAHTNNTYYNEFKGIAKTIIFANVPTIKSEILNTFEINNCFDNASFINTYGTNNTTQFIDVTVSGQGTINIYEGVELMYEQAFNTGSTDVKQTYSFLINNEVQVSIPFIEEVFCINTIKIYSSKLDSLFYTICDVEYEAVYIEDTPYTENDLPLYAYELSTAQHSTEDGIYIIKIEDYTSEPIYINNSTNKKEIAYKVNSWRSCSLKNYTYVMWLEIKIDITPSGDASISEQQNRNVIVDEHIMLGRTLNVIDVIPYYVAEILRIALTFDEVQIDQNAYTITDKPSYELIDEKSFFHGFKVNLRKPCECLDYGDAEFNCLPALYIINNNGNIIGNGSITSGTTAIINVAATFVNNVTIRYVIEENTIATATYTAKASDVGTYTTINNGGLTNVDVIINSVSVSAPFTINIGDTIEITYDAATANTEIELNGTY